jgi:nucleoside-diphosphate-sugar epimerase
MNILVTGGLGLIGHNVVARLQKQGHSVVITDTRTNYGIIPQPELDYLMTERLKKIQPGQIHAIDIVSDTIEWLFSRYNFDIVIHMASFPRQKVVNANPALGAKTMMEGLLNLCELSKKHKIKKFVFISSSMVYGDFDNDVTEDYNCKPQGQYGIMKLAGEDIVKDYSRRNCFTHTIIRPSAVYGPLDVEDRVIAKFMLTAMRGSNLRVNGAGETLDFTYVDDAADGIVKAALSEHTSNKTYNITKSHSVSLLQAAEMIVDLVGKGTIECRDKDADFPSRGALNIDAARKDFGYDPKVDVEEGFQNYYNWLNNSVYWSKKAV